MLSNLGPINIPDPLLTDLLDYSPAEDVLNNNTGTGEVTLAVVDTGCDVLHPELSLNIWSNPCEPLAHDRPLSSLQFLQPYYAYKICVQRMVVSKVGLF
jgi:subtilisin family serine protease